MISTNSKIITALALIVGVVMIASPLAFIGGSDNADAPVLGDASTANGTYTIQTQGASTPSDWTDDVYAYWSQYDGTSTNLSSFVLGSYSSISSAPLTQSVFTMTYAEVAM